MEERTGRRGQSESQIGGEETRNGRLVGAAETSKERAEWRRLQRKNWSILGLPKRKDWPQCHRESSWQERQSRPCQRKRNRAVCPKHQIMRGRESRWARATPWREREIRARAWSGKGGLHRERGQIPRRTGRASKESLPRASRRKHERVSGRKSSPERSAESWFHSKSGQI